MTFRFDARLVLLFLLVPACLILSSVVQAKFGDIGPDGDDIMRLVQIQDLLNGQAWFDLQQYRMGPEGGTAMHWSRLVDLPILLLFHLFNIFLPSETALVWAYTVWPPLSVLLLLAGLYTGARHLGGKGGALACLLLSAFIFSTHYRFMPGAIDHHNLQLGLLALALGCAVDPSRRPARLALAGLSVAASVAIGGEVYVFVGIICGFVALDWAISGEAARRGAMGFGAGLAAGLELAFFATVAPSNYAVVACDALSSVSLLAGLAGGLGLVLAALLASARGLGVRMAALLCIGAASAAVLLLVGPQCLSNPLSDLSPEVKTLWLDRIDEARPLFAERPGRVAKIGFMLGIALLALGLSLYGAYRGKRLRANLLFASLLVSALLMSVYQVRFAGFGHVFAIIPLSLWVADTYRDGKARNPSSVAYIGALALSLPFLWAVPGLILSPKSATANDSNKSACLDDSLFERLNALETGRILAPTDFAPRILNRTDHSVLQGNYHRNHDGIALALDILMSPPGETEALLSEGGIDYIVLCEADGENKLLAERAPGGLAARLTSEHMPEYLVPVDEKASPRLYRVRAEPESSSEDDELS